MAETYGTHTGSTGSLTGLTDAQAQEFHAIFTKSFMIFVAEMCIGMYAGSHAQMNRLSGAPGADHVAAPGDEVAAHCNTEMVYMGGHVSGAMSYTAFAINNKGKVRALAVAMEKRHPLLPDAPTFKELGVDWVDGAFRGIGMPKSSTPEQRKRMSDLWAALNADPEMKELAAKSGFELVDVGVDRMDAFMKDKIRVYSDAGKRLGLGAK